MPKKKLEVQREMNKAMMEEDRKIEEMRIKKNNREYWDYLKGPEDREKKIINKEHELFIENKINTNKN